MPKNIKNYNNLVDSIQRITIYETCHSFYIIGTCPIAKFFKVIKIDRTSDPKVLSYSEDMHEYNEEEIQELIAMVNIDNNIKQSTNALNNGVLRTYNALALIGFIRFLEGYYMIFITKQTPIAFIGYHTIYTIDDIIMIYIPYVIDKTKKEANLDEQKYLKMFQTIDFKQNFYYSYTYDLTNTLQFNLVRMQTRESSDENLQKIYGFRNKPCYKFMWNEFFLKPVLKRLNYQWVVRLVHGFLAQSSLNIYGCNLLVTIISRRSQKYAGTRFLKRGGNNEGFVANEVETEQIVHNASISSFEKGYFTSFVFCRGSIPLFWSQDPKQVPKPPINIDIVDPFATVAAKHFKQLIQRFGAPIIVLNLVKMQKKAQESILAEEYRKSLEYLRQFLPKDDYIEYICFDMAKLNKTDKGNVMNKLYTIAENCVNKTRFFRNFETHELNSQYKNEKKLMLQNGVVRVNCVDCLDRTNTAMYVIGKCALTHQLYALGLISSLNFEADAHCERMLVELYERSGDCIAQQYAGSQLVHRVDTYGKNSLASQSRDMIHTISRYYSNAFADADKQNGMNIFLGIFEPSLYNFHIWDLEKDIYLHDAFITQPWKIPKNYIEWIDFKTFKCLPLSYDQEYKNINSLSHLEEIKEKDDFRINEFDSFYKPYEFCAFHELFYFNNMNASRLESKNSSTGSFSGNLKAIILDPFITKTKKINPNNTSFNKSTLFHATNSSDEEADDFYDLSIDITSNQTFTKNELSKIKKTNTQFSLSEDFVISEESLKLYKKYAKGNIGLMDHTSNSLDKIPSVSQFSACSIISLTDNKKSSNQVFQSREHSPIKKVIKPNSIINIINNEKTNNGLLKKTSTETISFYSKYLSCGINGPEHPSEKTIKMYDLYCKSFTRA